MLELLAPEHRVTLLTPAPRAGQPPPPAPLPPGASVVPYGAPGGARPGAGGAALLGAARGLLRAAVQGKSGALGVAFDGDADRALFVDERGEILSGDHVMLILAREMQRSDALPGATVVGTVMSNVGLEVALKREGIALERTPVGDRYVLERMREAAYRFGGEQSGHIIDLTRNTTGDGPLTAVTLFATVARSGATLHEMAHDLITFPQILVNVRVNGDKATIAERPAVLAAIARAERELAGNGRILVRPSGTEPLVRVMLEGPDRGQIDRLANDVADAIREAALA